MTDFKIPIAFLKPFEGKNKTRHPTYRREFLDKVYAFLQEHDLCKTHNVKNCPVLSIDTDTEETWFLRMVRGKVAGHSVGAFIVPMLKSLFERAQVLSPTEQDFVLLQSLDMNEWNWIMDITKPTIIVGYGLKPKDGKSLAQVKSALVETVKNLVERNMPMGNSKVLDCRDGHAPDEQEIVIDSTFDPSVWKRHCVIK